MSDNVQTSIIMPNYNGEKYIAESIDSVLAQSENSWELLICDDGSTDRSNEIIEGYCAKDPRIKLLKNSNPKGQSGARNTAIAVAIGHYIAF